MKHWSYVNSSLVSIYFKKPWFSFKCGSKYLWSQHLEAGCTAILPTFERLKQKDHKFKVSLGFNTKTLSQYKRKQNKGHHHTCAVVRRKRGRYWVWCSLGVRACTSNLRKHPVGMGAGHTAFGRHTHTNSNLRISLLWILIKGFPCMIRWNPLKIIN